MEQGLSRRRLLEAGFFTGVAGVGLRTSSTGAVAVQQSADSWPMFNLDPANSGHAPSGTGPTTGVARTWSFPATEARESSVAVANGTVYIGSSVGKVHAVTAEDGSRRWSVETDDDVHSTPAVVDGSVYVGDEHAFYALAAADGSEQWRFSGDSRGYWSPAVVDGVVYVTTFESRVYALDASDGSERWSNRRRDPLLSAPAVANDTVYFCSPEGTVSALNASDGSERWSVQVNEELFASPAVVADTLFVGSDAGRVYALDASDGSERWTVQTSRPVRSTPGVAGDTVYIGSFDGNVYALDAGDGSTRWSFQTESEIGSSPAVVDETIYIGSTAGTVYALDADDGSERWSVRMDDSIPPFSAFSVAENTVYVRTEEGIVHAFSGNSTETPSPTDTRTETPTDGSVTENSPTDVAVDSVSGTGQRGVFTPVLRKPGVSLLFGGSVLGAGVLAAKLFRDTVGAGATATESETAIGDIWSEAEQALSAATDAEANNNYEQALDEYDRAIQACESVLENLQEDDEKHEEIAAVLETARHRHKSVKEQYSVRSELLDSLETAETHFQTAIAAPASEKIVIPRERYRQARNAYDDALDLLDDVDEDTLGDALTVTPNPTVEPPPENLNEFPGVHPAAQDLLTELGLDTLTAIQNADSDTLATLRDDDAIGQQLTVRLIGLNRWHGGDDVEFGGREAIERRRNLADEGYQLHR